LAADKTYDNLDLTLKEANEHRNEWFEGVYKCQKTDSLYDVMEKIVKAEVSKFVIYFINKCAMLLRQWIYTTFLAYGKKRRAKKACQLAAQLCPKMVGEIEVEQQRRISTLKSYMHSYR